VNNFIRLLFRYGGGRACPSAQRGCGESREAFDVREHHWWIVFAVQLKFGDVFFPRCSKINTKYMG